jgi:hypothetical protein
MTQAWQEAIESDLCSHAKPGEHISAESVRAKPMIGRGPCILCRNILLDGGIIRGNEFGENRGKI